MNPAINIALIAAAAKKEQASAALLKQLTDSRAFGPSSAILLQPDGPEQERELSKLIGTAVVRSWKDRYYFDREAKKAWEQEQSWIALAVVLGVLSLLASGVALLLI